MPNTRKYVAISIKHTEYGWCFGKPCTLWGQGRTKDDEKRSFSGYTEYLDRAELYSLNDWLNSSYGKIIKMDEPVKITKNLCRLYKDYDTVLVEEEAYKAYCTLFNIPLNKTVGSED